MRPITPTKPTATRDEIARVLRTLRERAGISQEGLAANADLDRTYVGRVERGHHNPTVLVVDRLLAVIGVSWAEFGAAFDAYCNTSRADDAGRSDA